METEYPCPQCGSSLDESSNCLTCFYSTMPSVVVLRSERNGQSISLRVTTTIGKRRLRTMFEDEACYISDEQFIIIRNEDVREWILVNSISAKNPTYCNGVPIPSDGVTLSDADEISVKGKIMKLKVQL